MRRLAVLGASGHGQVVADAALESGWDEVTFFDDLRAEAFPGHRVAGTAHDLVSNTRLFDGVVIGIGDNRTRLRLQDDLERAGAKLVVVRHAGAIVSRRARIGAGTVVLAGAVVNTGAQIGRGCIINTTAVVEHHCRLADGVHVAPGALLAGGVIIDLRAWVGIGASVLQDIRIGADAVIGAGAAVINNVENGATVVGVPARSIRC